MDTGVVLEWKNLNLTLEQREFSYLKCRDKVEEKRILDNGMIMSKYRIHVLNLIFDIWMNKIETF